MAISAFSLAESALSPTSSALTSAQAPGRAEGGNALMQPGTKPQVFSISVRAASASGDIAASSAAPLSWKATAAAAIPAANANERATAIIAVLLSASSSNLIFVL